MPLRKGTRKAKEQARGTAANVREFSSETGVDDALPSGVRSLVGELLRVIPHALGRGTARQQITSSIILGILVVLTAPLSLGWSLVFLVPLGFTLLAGVLRFIPVVNNSWSGSRAQRALSKDRDVPGWRRE